MVDAWATSRSRNSRVEGSAQCKILDNHQNRMLCAQGLDEGQHGRNGLLFLSFRRQREWGIAALRGNRQQRRQQRYQPGERRSIGGEHGLKLAQLHRWRIIGLMLTGTLKQFNQRIEGTVLRRGKAAALATERRYLRYMCSDELD